MRKAEAATKVAVFIAALLPLLSFIDDYLSDALIRPWRTLINESGLWSIRFLILGLCLSPLATLSGVSTMQNFRRMIGLFGAFYAAVHLFAWARQYGFDWLFLGEEIVLRFYLTVGFLGALLLVPLAMTSPEIMHRRLGSVRWRRLHMLIYPVVTASVLHFALAHRVTELEVAIDILLMGFAFLWRVLPRSRRIP